MSKTGSCNSCIVICVVSQERSSFIGRHNLALKDAMTFPGVALFIDVSQDGFQHAPGTATVLLLPPTLQCIHLRPLVRLL